MKKIYNPEYGISFVVYNDNGMLLNISGQRDAVLKYLEEKDIKTKEYSSSRYEDVTSVYFDVGTATWKEFGTVAVPESMSNKDVKKFNEIKRKKCKKSI